MNSRSFDESEEMSDSVGSPESMENGVHRPIGVRAARLAIIRAMIDDGSYETHERMDAAVARLLCDVVDVP